MSRGMPNLAHHDNSVVFKLCAPIFVSWSSVWPFRSRTLRNAWANSVVENGTVNHRPVGHKAGVSEEDEDDDNDALLRAVSQFRPQLPVVRPNAGATMGSASRLPGRAHLCSKKRISM